MALVLRLRVLEGCDGMKYRDTTGPYDVTDNPTGYGSENDVDGPQDFTSYTLSIWAPGLDPATDAPSYTQNLLLSIPTPDDDDWYTWQTTQQSVPSGVWYIRAVGTTDTTSYTAATKAILLKDVKTEVIDPVMLAYDPTCGCKEGCTDPLKLFMLFDALKKNGICDLTKAQVDIDYLYSQKGCC